MPSAFIGEREPERRFLMRRFAPKRPFGTGSEAGGETEGSGGEGFLFLSSLPSERFSFAAEGDEVLRLGHDGARMVSIVDRARYRARYRVPVFYFLSCLLVCYTWAASPLEKDPVARLRAT